MKKNTRTFLILLLLLAVCVTAYFTIVMKKAELARQQAEEEAASVVTINKFEGEVTDITYYNGTETLSFVKDNYTWVWADDAEYPLNASPIRSIATAMENLTAVRSMSLNEAPTAYGINDGSHWVTATTDAGETLTVKIGNYVNYNYYCMVPDTDIVYQVDYVIPEAISNTLKDLLITESFEDISNAIVNGVYVVDGDRSLAIMAQTIEAGQKYSYKDAVSGAKVTETAENSGSYWFVNLNSDLFKATDFIMPNEDPETAGMNAPALYYFSSFNEAFTEFEMGENYGFKLSDAELKECGLDAPIMLGVSYLNVASDYSTTEGGYILYVGNAFETDEGTFRYVQLAGSNLVNVMSSSAIDKLLELTAKFFPAE